MARSSLWSRLQTLERRFPDLGPPVSVVIHRIVGPGDPPPSIEARQRRDALVEAAVERWRATGAVQVVKWDPLSIDDQDADALAVETTDI